MDFSLSGFNSPFGVELNIVLEYWYGIGTLLSWYWITVWVFCLCIDGLIGVCLCLELIPRTIGMRLDFCMSFVDE